MRAVTAGRPPARLPGSEAFSRTRLRADGDTPSGRSPSGGNAGWTIFGYLLAGMAFYGGAGWLVGRWVHATLLFPLGMLAGLAVAIALITLKYGRS